jgi:hypothetical protein
MHSTSKVDHGREADKIVEEMVKKSKSGQGTLTYTPNKTAPRRIAAAGKATK